MHNINAPPVMGSLRPFCLTAKQPTVFGMATALCVSSEPESSASHVHMSSVQQPRVLREWLARYVSIRLVGCFWTYAQLRRCRVMSENMCTASCRIQDNYRGRAMSITAQSSLLEAVRILKTQGGGILSQQRPIGGDMSYPGFDWPCRLCL
jgi:hypothetical protein